MGVLQAYGRGALRFCVFDVVLWVDGLACVWVLWVLFVLRLFGVLLWGWIMI